MRNLVQKYAHFAIGDLQDFQIFYEKDISVAPLHDFQPFKKPDRNLSYRFWGNKVTDKIFFNLTMRVWLFWWLWEMCKHLSVSKPHLTKFFPEAKKIGDIVQLALWRRRRIWCASAQSGRRGSCVGTFRVEIVLYLRYIKVQTYSVLGIYSARLCKVHKWGSNPLIQSRVEQVPQEIH